ncbi:MAG: bifunctional aspartate kinase/homoserine dehydrogenase I [Prevotellaceae bacterium]|jgi:aspartokinase/homoserine dehydrogenase 1|nr:bifunctional aspartate kinase/homoserine dehydrogenase I [Prevotellaceae bacterium]
MKVLKFGGTSVGSVNSILQIKQIIKNESTPLIIVVSAMGGVTDRLIDIAYKAAQGNAAYEGMFNHILKQHRQTIEGVIDDVKIKISVQKIVNELFCELANLYRGVFLIRDLSNRTLDTIVSYGERISSVIMNHVLKGSELIDARLFIKTEFRYNKHIVDMPLTNRLIAKYFDQPAEITVVPGFISSSKQNDETTNLGRGGSDYTASLLAAALDVKALEIWTDVDGFMSADPKLISQAYVIENLSYVEAMELCNFGAKIIYPPTIYPVYNKNIPIKIKNTFNPNARGSFIVNHKHGNDKQIIKGISSINDTALITVQGLGMVGVIGVNYRIFKALAKGNVSVFMVAQASSENTTTLAVKIEDADEAVRLLQVEFANEINYGEINKIFAEKDMATIAVVGEEMKGRHGIAGKLFGTLGRNGINVVACAEGALGRNISFVVDRKNLNKALNAIHDSFFLSEYKTLNVFLVGVGTVGKDLLQQIKQQQNKLLQQNALKLNVVGIANSKHCIVNNDGIDIDNYKELLANSTQKSSPEILKKFILDMNLPDSVFVDCTASTDIAGIYNCLLNSNISVVTANKIAASSDYDNYLKLKNSAIKQGVKFLFETNVGAGLPIINTINALINSGDRIRKIEAVLSGTLNYIFNTISDKIPFSQTVIMAREAGYAEPDPRIDLSGADVIRKLVILARESGYILEQNDVKSKLFIPSNFLEGSTDDFFDKLKTLDADFEEKRRKLEQENKRWRFCASLDDGKAEVKLIEVGINHSFYELEGSNNIITLTTDRYQNFPMMIKGYGAGADVTAAGVFSDIISIANIR